MSTLPTLPAKLSPPLSSREAVADALYRCIQGFDTNDETLFDSAFTQTASCTIRGQTSQGLPTIRANIFDRVSKLDTTHFVTNTRINIADDDASASMTVSVLAQHYRLGKGLAPDQPHLLGGTLYYLDLVKDFDGIWKIQDLKIQIVWTDGDRAVVSGE